MEEKKAKIRESALLHILHSCLKSGRREAFGYLTGIRTKNRWDIKNSFFASSGGYGHVPQNNGLIKERAILEEMSLEIIGDFHTHTNSNRNLHCPSEIDIEDMSKNPLWLYLIVNVSERKKKSPLKNNVYGFSRSLDNRFLNVRAFSYNSERRRGYDEIRIHPFFI
jgi:proteasome lid subunit RPN8/RPN11